MFERDAFGQFAVLAELVQITGDGAGAAAAIVVGFFEAVEFFNDGQGNDNFTAFKGEERLRIVDQDVSVEDEGFQARLHGIKSLDYLEERVNSMGVLTTIGVCPNSSGF